MTNEERFWAKVDRSGDCWLWTAGRTPTGYGQFRPGGLANSRHAHAVSWEMANGRRVAAGLQINHTCHVRACVRPEHLYEGTQQQNMIDKAESGWRPWNADKTHCKRGHEFTEENTYHFVQVRNGREQHSRQCRECRRVSSFA